MNWRDYGYLVASKYRIKVILALLPHPKTPKQVSTETEIGMTHVSRTIRELVIRDLVYCINPQELKGRVYDLTDRGRKLATIIESDRLKSR